MESVERVKSLSQDLSEADLRGADLNRAWLLGAHLNMAQDVPISCQMQSSATGLTSPAMMCR
jgi:uncharacterized protein YjbI with pentapeptide repeats